MNTDVVVIGGGPAGSAAAFALARAGLGVAVVERTRFDGPRVGELLSPDVAASLHRMGVWRRFADDVHVPARGVVSSWGEAEPRFHDYFSSPYGHGWLVDRRRFDRLLFEAAVEAGARAFPGAAARRCSREGDGWTVEATAGDRVVSIGSRYVIDATGRARGVRRGTRRRLDRLVAYVCYLEGAVCERAQSQATVEARNDGWWFSAPLPRQKRVLMFLTDDDLLPRACDPAAEFWRRLERTRLTGDQLPQTPVPHRFYRFAADSQWRPSYGHNRIAVGDALLSMDPLSGRGVHAALDSGRLAAEAIVAQEQGDAEALSRCADAERRRFTSYLAERVEQYRPEGRWSSSPFWSRRRLA